MLQSVHRTPFPRLFLLFFLGLGGAVIAAPTPTPTPGRIDASFVPAPGTNDAVNAVIPQPDGKVIVAGRFTQANNVLDAIGSRASTSTARSIPPSILVPVQMRKLPPPFFNPTAALWSPGRSPVSMGLPTMAFAD